jgi:hypothetical protein
VKAAYVIYARNKAHFPEAIDKALKSAFAQTHQDMEIVVSDQGSTDGTREILANLVAAAADPRVRLVDCPETGVKGMAGLNAHVNWLFGNVDADVLIPQGIDDFAAPARAARIIDAFERTGADMVGTAMYFQEPGSSMPGGRSSFNREGWVTVKDEVTQKVGGSSAPAWRRSLWERVQPIPALFGTDVWLPALACVLGGFYYVNEPLFTYVNHADPNNCGIEGIERATPEAERAPITEHRYFQVTGSWMFALRRMLQLGVGTPDERNWVKEAALVHCEALIDARVAMTVNHQAPLPFPI